MDENDDFEFDRSSQSETHLKQAIVTSAFSNLTESIIDTHTAVKVLAVTVTAEIGTFAMFYVSKDKVITSLAESEIDIWIYGGIAVFLIGFLTAFAAYRLIATNGLTSAPV